MAHWVKIFVVKDYDLSLVPGSHVKCENRETTPQNCILTTICTHVHIVNKCKEDIQKVGTFMTGLNLDLYLYLLPCLPNSFQYT